MPEQDVLVRSPDFMPDARALLEGRRSKVGGPVYVIGGPSERRVTLYSQQVRALNMVAALHAVHGAALRTMEVAVVGAGAAGVTAATALRSLGVKKLTVYDEAGAPMHAQRASYTRFLHPGLFHWPELGWDDPDANLPVSTWSAAYADIVRSRILSTCQPSVEYCASVESIAGTEAVNDGHPAADVTVRRLWEPKGTVHRYQLVLVATGFPFAPAPPGAVGGSYWHDSGDVNHEATKRGKIHIVGDGDDALTEVLMLFMNVIGHEKLTPMVAQLAGDTHADVLAEAVQSDLKAQGIPANKAMPPPKLVSDRLKEMFRWLALANNWNVEIHACDAPKGKSFLLNRVLLWHLMTTEAAPPPPVTITSERIDTKKANSNDAKKAQGNKTIARLAETGTVIWSVPWEYNKLPPEFEKPVLSANASLSELDELDQLVNQLSILASNSPALNDHPTQEGDDAAKKYQDAKSNIAQIIEKHGAFDQRGHKLLAVARGALAQSIDALRRPHWTAEFAKHVTKKATLWTDAPAGRLEAAPGVAASSECVGALEDIKLVTDVLVGLEFPLRADAINDQRTAVSIDTVVRSTSVPHRRCVVPSATSNVCKETAGTACGRIWFMLPTKERDAYGATPIGRIMAALTDLSGLQAWGASPDTQRKLREGGPLIPKILRGISDLVYVKQGVAEFTSSVHRARGEFGDAIDALLLGARSPAVGPDDESADGNPIRRSMLGVAAVLDEAGRDHAGFSTSDIELLVAAAAANLAVPAPEGPRTLTPSRSTADDWARVVGSLNPGNVRWVTGLSGYAAGADRPLADAVADPGAIATQADLVLAQSSSDHIARLLGRFGVLSAAPGDGWRPATVDPS
jgi:Pyridine nucleotide-disulphide oxidoreductase